MRPLLERLGGFLPAAIALALPTVFIPIAVDSYILPRAAIVIAGAGLGFALALLVPGRSSLGPLRLPLIAAAAAALLAFAFSVSWPVSLVGSYTRYESVPIRLAYLGLLAVPVWLLADHRSRDRVIAAFVLGTSIASLQALWQEVLLANHLIDYRPDGNLGNANLLGALLAMAIPLAIARGLRGGRFVVAWWLGVAVMAGALVATTSRSGGVGALAGCIALVVLSLRGKRALWRRGQGRRGDRGGAPRDPLLPSASSTTTPGPSRLHLWPDAIHMIAARPLTGWGEDATGLVFGRLSQRELGAGGRPRPFGASRHRRHPGPHRPCSPGMGSRHLVPRRMALALHGLGGSARGGVHRLHGVGALQLRLGARHRRVLAAGRYCMVRRARGQSGPSQNRGPRPTCECLAPGRGDGSSLLRSPGSA